MLSLSSADASSLFAFCRAANPNAYPNLCVHNPCAPGVRAAQTAGQHWHSSLARIATQSAHMRCCQPPYKRSDGSRSRLDLYMALGIPGLGEQRSMARAGQFLISGILLERVLLRKGTNPGSLQSLQDLRLLHKEKALVHLVRLHLNLQRGFLAQLTLATLGSIV